MEWLVGQTAEEAIGVMIAGGEYPDFVDASSGMKSMVDAGAFIAIDDYWDDYPNIKNFYTEAEWNSIRAEDGHVYIIPQFGKTWEKDTTCVSLATEAGYILEFSFAPMSDEGFQTVIAFMGASIQPEDAEESTEAAS